MSTPAPMPLQRLATLPPTFTTNMAENAGLWRPELYELCRDETVIELSRGVYRKADAPETAYIDWLAVQHRVPEAIICLTSAMEYHELTDEIPAVVSFAVPRGKHVARIDFPPTEVSTFKSDTFELGMTTVEVAPGERVRVYDRTRTVIDALRSPRRVSQANASRALYEYLRGPDAHLATLTKYARIFHVSTTVQRAIELVRS